MPDHLGILASTHAPHLFLFLPPSLPPSLAPRLQAAGGVNVVIKAGQSSVLLQDAFHVPLLEVSLGAGKAAGGTWHVPSPACTEGAALARTEPASPLALKVPGGACTHAAPPAQPVLASP